MDFGAVSIGGVMTYPKDLRCEGFSSVNGTVRSKLECSVGCASNECYVWGMNVSDMGCTICRHCIGPNTGPPVGGGIVRRRKIITTRGKS